MFRNDNWLEERFRFPSGGERRSVTPVFGATGRQYESYTQSFTGKIRVLGPRETAFMTMRSLAEAFM